MALGTPGVDASQETLLSFLDRVYEPHKRKIWAGIALFFAIVIGYLAVRSIREHQLDEAWNRYEEGRKAFTLSLLDAPDATAARNQIEMLSAVAKDYPDASVTPYALLQIVKAHFAIGEYEQAQQTLEKLRSQFRDFPLNNLTIQVDPSGPAKPIAQVIEESIRREKEWSGQHAYVHHWPSDERLALVETSVGSFWMGFYSAAGEAPQHADAFIQRAKRGDYNGRQVYLVLQSVDGKGERFECGSLASGLQDKGGERDPATHDRDEATDTIEAEETRTTIHHEYRVVSAAKMASGESASAFLVVTKRTGLAKLNGDTTPFAAVMDREKSLETIDRIGQATTYATHADTKTLSGMFRMRDHPYPPIYLRRVSIWSKEKLEEGHAWDTARVASENPEPWEAGRTSPKPDEFSPPTSTEQPKKDDGK
jgi:cyclophilin family peptidyl-prolyl cis-trans isomerase